MAFKLALRFSLFALLALPAGCSTSTTEDADLAISDKDAQPVMMTDGSFLLSFRSAEQSEWSAEGGASLEVVDEPDGEFPVGRMLTTSALQEGTAEAGVFYDLPESVAQSLVGQRVHMSIRAKASEATTDGSGAPLQFAVSASYAGKDVPWKVFSASLGDQDHVYEFDFPAANKDAEQTEGRASIRIWPDIQGTGQPIDVKYIAVRQVGQLSQSLLTEDMLAQDEMAQDEAASSDLNTNGAANGGANGLANGLSGTSAALLAQISNTRAIPSKIMKDGHLIYLFNADQIADWSVSKNSTLSLSIDPQTGTGVGRVNADAPAPLRRRGEMGVRRKIDAASAAAMAGARVRVTIKARKATGSANVGFGVSLRNQQDGTRWHFFQPTDTYRHFTFETLFPGRKNEGGDQAAVSIWGDALGRNQFVLIESVKIESLEDLEAQSVNADPNSEADIMLLSASDSQTGGQIKARGMKISGESSNAEKSGESSSLAGKASANMSSTASSLGLISTSGREPGQFLTKEEYQGSHILHLASYFNQRQALRGWTILSQRHPDVLSGETPILTEAQINGKNYIRLSLSALDKVEAKELCSIIQATGDYCLVIPK